jgi:hypothetical protein
LNGELETHPQSGLNDDISAPAHMEASPPVADSVLWATITVGNKSKARNPIFLTTLCLRSNISSICNFQLVLVKTLLAPQTIRRAVRFLEPPGFS